MKTTTSKIKTSIIGLGLTLLTLLPNVTKANGGMENLSKENANKINLPESLKKSGYNEKVKIYYVLDSDGKVKDVSASTENKELKKSVEQQFKKLSFPGMTPNIGNILVINFKVY